jgi:adenine-specific DNA-methyltransferase
VKNLLPVEKRSISSLKSNIEDRKSVLVRADALEVLEELTDCSDLVRLVLIDPPYNRRTKFHHYNDSTCSFKWLEMLKLHCTKLRNLLTIDGSLWMHIDDAEMHTSRVMLDELFGKNNFIATIVWQKSVSRDNRTPISTTHEYILVYAKNKPDWTKARHKLPATDEQLNRYKNPDSDIRGPWTSGDMTAKAGPGRRSSQFYDLELPSGRIVTPSKGTCWRYTRERLEELVSDNRIDFGSGNKMPRLKRFLSEVEPGLVPDTWWSGEDVGTADSAKRYLKSLFPDIIPFETPKPEKLAARIIHIATNPGDLVLDVYGGSGTTAAVSHKMNRRWLTVEKESRTFNEFTLPRIQSVVETLKNDNRSDINEFTVLESEY